MASSTRLCRNSSVTIKYKILHSKRGNLSEILAGCRIFDARERLFLRELSKEAGKSSSFIVFNIKMEIISEQQRLCHGCLRAVAMRHVR